MTSAQELSTSTPSQPLEDSFDELKQRSLRSLFWHCKVCWGMKDLTPGLHGDLCDFIQLPASASEEEPVRKAVQMARAHLKTCVAGIGDMLHRATNFLEGSHPLSGSYHEFPILYMLSTALNAYRISREIARMWGEAPVYHWLHPNIVRGPEWSKGCKQLDYVDSSGRVVRRVTIDFKGVEARVSSNHYRLLKFDDIHAAEEAMDSPPAVTTVVSRYQHSDSLTIEPDKDPIHLIGSPCSIHPPDVYTYVADKEADTYKWFIRPCYDKLTGEPVWPERFPRHVLEAIRRKEGDVKFSYQYLLDPIDELVAEFRMSDFFRFSIINGGMGPCYVTEDRRKYHHAHLFPWSLVDLAGWRGTGDSNAILTGGTTVDNRNLLLDEFKKRCSPDDVIQTIVNHHDRFGTQVVGVEEVAYQECLSFYLDKRIIKDRLNLRIIPCKPRGKNKDVRIRGMQPMVRERQIGLHDGLPFFSTEASHFPKGEKHLLDCFAYLPFVASTPVRERLEEIEDRERRVYLRSIGEDANMPISESV